MHFNRNIGMLLLAIFLIVWGLVMLLGISGVGAILAILAIAAGIFILLGREVKCHSIKRSGGFR
jgi:hypothetical protein